MGTALAQTYNEQLQTIVEKYRAAGEEWPASARDIAIWAYNAGEWRPKSGDVLKQCAGDIAKALREEYYTDPQGRAVRTKHAAREERAGKQQMLWDDIRTAEPEHMEQALKLRRNQIVGECSQLKRDQDSYNDNNVFGAEIQLSFNFENDVAEAEAADGVDKSLGRRRPR